MITERSCALAKIEEAGLNPDLVLAWMIVRLAALGYRGKRRECYAHGFLEGATAAMYGELSSEVGDVA